MQRTTKCALASDVQLTNVSAASLNTLLNSYLGKTNFASMCFLFSSQCTRFVI